jgi:hypothetical protein
LLFSIFKQRYIVSLILLFSGIFFIIEFVGCPIVEEFHVVTGRGESPYPCRYQDKPSAEKTDCDSEIKIDRISLFRMILKAMIPECTKPLDIRQQLIQDLFATATRSEDSRE